MEMAVDLVHAYNDLSAPGRVFGFHHAGEGMARGYRSPIKVTVERGGSASTARGGLVLELPAAKRVLAGLPGAAGSPSQGWSDGQMVLAVLAQNRRRSRVQLWLNDQGRPLPRVSISKSAGFGSKAGR